MPQRILVFLPFALTVVGLGPLSITNAEELTPEPLASLESGSCSSSAQSLEPPGELTVPRESRATELSEVRPLRAYERVDPERVALGGNCPVALVDSGKLVPGSPALQYLYRGVVYQLGSAAAATRFASQPARYSLPTSPFDPVAASETRERTTESLNVFSLYDRKSWFFLNTDRNRTSLLRPDPYPQSALAR